MSELRQNIATQEWVIVADERARRPDDLAEPDRRTLTHLRPGYAGDCPFCPGNEEVDLQLATWPADGPWRTRLVRNRYPALTSDGTLWRDRTGVARRLAGVGYHEVLVAHRRHNTTLGLMSRREVAELLTSYRARGRELSQDGRIEHVVYFKNHGSTAGASLAHPHGQLMALPMVPGQVRQRLDVARDHLDQHGACVYCTIVADELASPDRLLAVNQYAAAFVVFAAQSPFHTWIVPRRHCPDFLSATRAELGGVAAILREVLRKLYDGLRDPAFNLIIRSAPVREPATSYFHWYVTVVPRLSYTAGFEMGTGIRISPAIPEDCATFLRAVPVRPVRPVSDLALPGRFPGVSSHLVQDH